MVLERSDGRDHCFERAAVGAKDARPDPYRRHHPASAFRALTTGTYRAGTAVRDERGKIARASHLRSRSAAPDKQPLEVEGHRPRSAVSRIEPLSHLIQ